MAALKEISFSCQLLAGIEVRTAKASCHWPLLSHALIAAVKTADLGCPVDGTPAHLQLVNKLIQRIGCSRQAEPHEFRASFSCPRKPQNRHSSRPCQQRCELSARDARDPGFEEEDGVALCGISTKATINTGICLCGLEKMAS